MTSCRICTLVFAFFMTLEANADQPRVSPCTPNLLYKVASQWLLVDGYHNRLLVSDRLSGNLADWREFAQGLRDAHSLASDSRVIVADGSAENRLVVYVRDGDNIREKTVINRVGERPHRVQYSEEKSAFYVLSAISGSISKYQNTTDGLRLVFSKDLPYLKGQYSRSFSIIRGDVYFVTTPGRIIQARFSDDSFSELNTIELPDAAGSPNDIFLASDGWWYVSATPQTLIRAKNLEEFQLGSYEDVYSTWNLKGTPYYLSEYDGSLFIPTVTEYTSLSSIAIGADETVKPKIILDFGR